MLRSKLSVESENGDKLIRGYKETAIGKIPNDWGVIRFDKVCKFERGFSYRSNDISKIETKTQFM